MKKIIGTILFLIWIPLAFALLVEPTFYDEPQTVALWVVLAYCALLFGLPIIFTHLLHDKNKPN